MKFRIIINLKISWFSEDSKIQTKIHLSWKKFCPRVCIHQTRHNKRDRLEINCEYFSVTSQLKGITKSFLKSRMHFLQKMLKVFHRKTRKKIAVRRNLRFFLIEKKSKLIRNVPIKSEGLTNKDKVISSKRFEIH